MLLFQNIQHAIESHSDRAAFFINGISYRYIDFAKSISAIRLAIESGTKENDNIIGVVTNDDLETYASIFALWLTGKGYVPINPDNPMDRNENIIEQAGILTMIDSSAVPYISDLNLIESAKLPETVVHLTPKTVSDDALVYLLFTSGTTGQPKGVPITRANLSAFVSAFESLGIVVDQNDRCLQMFELTFDLSVFSYLVPILKGACVFTIPKDKIKYSYIYELMEDQKLTVSLMVPSMLHYLRSYFNEIHLPQMKYSLFCGEALPLDITAEWANCLPNAQIYNVYGPTEDTIFCTQYAFDKNVESKTYHGVLSIGKAMRGSHTIIIDEDNRVLPPGAIGQLCLGGSQLTPGYWKNEEKNKEAFFCLNYNGLPQRFYKTGDLCQCDVQGDMLYVGRMDFQTKIQGFRVELSEIEFHARAFLWNKNLAAIAYADLIGNNEVGLVVESDEFDSTPLLDYLKAKMPVYMIPKAVVFSKAFPLNTNGKTDRKKLALLFRQTETESVN